MVTEQEIEELKLYKSAWLILAMCLGEQMNQEALDLMDAVLGGVKADTSTMPFIELNRQP